MTLPTKMGINGAGNISCSVAGHKPRILFIDVITNMDQRFVHG